MSTRLRTPEEAEVEVNEGIAFWRECLSKLISIRVKSKDGSSRPLNPEELNALAARQQEELTEFEAAVKASHSTLVELAAKGAEPVYVLAILHGWAPRMATELPRVAKLTFRSQDFKLLAPKDLKSLSHSMAAYGMRDNMRDEYAGREYAGREYAGREYAGRCQVEQVVLGCTRYDMRDVAKLSKLC